MWSSEFPWFVSDNTMTQIGDGHWWPESYFLGIHQAREALFEVPIMLNQISDIADTDN